jgi:pseudouridine-5'-phosphate glycosidase
MNEYVEIHEEIAEALAGGKPVVALESTIISHGMPHPENISMALEVERLVRENGATPATIAILDGKIHVGLTREQIVRIASGQNIYKATIRDIPRLLALNLAGATTVAATAYAAQLAGIRFFATGGLGGVHRGVNDTFDISADLTAMASLNICIFSSGVKSILDIPKTLELMETLGIAVYGYETDRFPGFYVRDTGCPVEKIGKEELVKLLRVKEKLGLGGCVSVNVPVPAQNELDPRMVESTIARALEEAEEQGVSGKNVTPFLLARVKESTQGRSLHANIALVKNNAITAAQVAAAYYEGR